MRLTQARNRWKLLSGYLTGRADLEAYPITLIVENTGKCNLKCPMCPRELGYYPPEDFDFGLFQQIIDEISQKTELVFPWGGGEPLMNPDIFRMVRYCKDADIYTVVSTNATLLDQRRSQELLESGLDSLIIAFDGTTPETYEKYRKGADFEKVRANILSFLEMKRVQCPDLFVVLQMVRLPENQHQVRDFQRMWSIDGVDEVRIKEDEIVIPDVALEERVQHTRRRHPCYQLWQGPAMVNYKGEFFPCCHTWQSEPIGNVRDSSIYNLWNSERMNRMREAHLKGDLTDYPECQDCHAPNPRLPVILGSFMVDTLKVRRLIPRMEKLAIFYKMPIFRDH